MYFNEDQFFDLVSSLSEREYTGFRKTLKKGTKLSELFEYYFQLRNQKIQIDQDNPLGIYSSHGAFRYAKSTLYRYLLTFLANGRRGENPETAILEYHNQIDVLINKGLFYQTIPLIEKAKKLALDHELFSQAINLIRREREIFELIFSGQALYSRLGISFQEEDELQAKASDLNYFEGLYKQARKARYLNDPERERLLGKIESSLMVKNQEYTLSTRAKIEYYKARFTLKLISGIGVIPDPEIRIIELIEENPFLLTDTILNKLYIKCTGIAGRLYADNNEFQLADYQIKRLLHIKHVFDSKGLNIIDIQKRIWFIQLIIANRQLDLQKGLSVINEIDRHFKTSPVLVEEELNIGLIHVIILFLLNQSQHKKAIPWINRNKNRSNEENRTDLIGWAKIIFIVVFFELSEYELVLKESYSAETFLRNNQLFGPVEEVLFTFFRTKSKEGSPSQKDYLRLEEKLKLLNPDLIRRKRNYFDFLSYLRSKIEYRPMNEIMREVFKTPH